VVLGAQLLVRARALHRTSSSSERASVGALILAGRRKQPRASPAQTRGAVGIGVANQHRLKQSLPKPPTNHSTQPDHCSAGAGSDELRGRHVGIKMSSGTQRAKITPSARLSATTSENILAISSSNTIDSSSPRQRGGGPAVLARNSDDAVRRWAWLPRAVRRWATTP
jgi:hypothetical protein